MTRAGRGRCAFVLGGGGGMGACEVGMLQALCARGIRPDLIIGTSVGAINGALFASDPSPGAVSRLREVWLGLGRRGVFSGSLLGRISTAVRTRTHLHEAGPLGQALDATLPVSRIEDLVVPFQCVAASIERASEHWFTEGPLVPAVLASAAVPGLFPPVRVGDEHFLDGGLVNSVPLGRAISLGASTVYVLQVGRIEQPLVPPRYPWEVAMVAFEIARRHRFGWDMRNRPAEVEVHVLPAGMEPRNSFGQFRYSDFRDSAARIDRACEASLAYLDGAASTEASR